MGEDDTRQEDGMQGSTGLPMWWRVVTSTVVFIMGCWAFYHEVSQTSFDRPWLLLLIASMIGLFGPDALLVVLRRWRP